MTDLVRYDGKRVVVVGCSTGIGAATVNILQSLGAEVHGVGSHEPEQPLASFTRCDLRELSEVESMIAAVASPLDGLFYCAGVPPTRPPLEVMAVNLAATRVVVEGLLPHVQRGGAIAIVASTGGLEYLANLPSITELLATASFDEALTWCADHIDQVADGYIFSKQALIVYAMTLAVTAVTLGVRINCVSPGPTVTPMMPAFEALGGAAVIAAFHGPMNRKAEPAEVGWPLVFLNSPAAGFLNGVNLVVDGGMLAGTTTGAIDVVALLTRAMERG